MKAVVITGVALRQCRRLDPDVRKRLRSKLEIYAATGTGDIKVMKGQDGARLRIGDWRIVFIENDAEVAVVGVGHRREIYR